MMEFLEFCWTNAWRVVILLFIGASGGGILCWVLASLFANDRIEDMFAERNKQKDEEFIKIKEKTQKDILKTFGVPSVLVGTRNTESARKRRERK